MKPMSLATLVVGLEIVILVTEEVWLFVKSVMAQENIQKKAGLVLQTNIDAKIVMERGNTNAQIAMEEVFVLVVMVLKNNIIDVI